MNISFPSLSTASTLPAAPTTPTGAASKPRETSSGLTVTETHVSDLDAVESVPDSALDRDDPLGRLVSSAFSLPPPPMPAFPDAGNTPIPSGISEVRV